MTFNELKQLIKKHAKDNEFQVASDILQNIIFNLNKDCFLELIPEIGSIPEDIEHDSTEEKLYTKVSDIILAKCFIELNLDAIVIRERANNGDVLARSKFHNYSLIADAKAFRLSRTAKNQKDYKVESMVHWKRDNDFGVLCCPYFQYPKKESQIYGQAIQGNISLFSWEYLYLLLTNNIIETETQNLKDLWNFSSTLANTTSVTKMNKCFIDKQNNLIKTFIKYNDKKFDTSFNKFKSQIISRGKTEIHFWEQEMDNIRNYSKEKAVDELIKALKLNQKIISIKSYIDKLRG